MNSQHKESAGTEQPNRTSDYVVVSRGEGGKRYHEPAPGLDPDTDEPEPLCPTNNGHDLNWNWRKREGIHVWKEPCRHDDCQDARPDDEQEIVTDGGISIADRVAEFTQDDRAHTRIEFGDVTVTVTRPADTAAEPVELALAATANVCDARGATTPADSPGHAGAVAAQLRQAEENGTLPDGVDLHGGDD